MKPFLHTLGSLLVLLAGARASFSADTASRLTELDAYWKEVARAVREGDFEGYKATCHEEGVLVSGTLKTSYPLSKALAGWRQGFMDTKDGKIKASVEFRFSQRWGDETTAHETGIFLYSTVDADGPRKERLVHFEALLVKKSSWKVLMEFQKGVATKEEWAALSN
jgi:hypothetical protein